MATSVEQLLKSMDELSSMFSTRMGEFEKNLTQPGSTVPNLTIKALAAEFYTFKTFVWKSLGILKTQVELVALGLDRMETQYRRKVLLFHGVKEDKDEDVLQKILGILSDQMKLSDARPTAIESCHRLGIKNVSARPILVRFSNVQLRTHVWKAKTALKGSKITLTEFLTKTRQEVFTAARKHFGIKKCWSADGVIVVLLPDKTRNKITTSSELKQLITKYPQKSVSNNDE